jgi:Nucleotide modification associated domain 1
MKVSDIDDILAELKAILIKKQEDYGPLNISLAPGGPYNGLRVRMFDKLQRFSHLVDNDNDTPNYESIRDTFIDLANYAIIGILVQNGQWEGLPDAKSSSVERPADSISRPRSLKVSPDFHQMVPTEPTVVRGGRVRRTRTKSLE